MCKNRHVYTKFLRTCICVSLKVVRRTPAIVVTLKTTSSTDDEETVKATMPTSEQSSLPVDTIDSTSSAVEKKPEASSILVTDSSTSEKTPAKPTSTIKRTKKSKPSRKST